MRHPKSVRRKISNATLPCTPAHLGKAAHRPNPATTRAAGSRKNLCTSTTQSEQLCRRHLARAHCISLGLDGTVPEHADPSTLPRSRRGHGAQSPPAGGCASRTCAGSRNRARAGRRYGRCPTAFCRDPARPSGKTRRQDGVACAFERPLRVRWARVGYWDRGLAGVRMCSQALPAPGLRLPAQGAPMAAPRSS